MALGGIDAGKPDGELLTANQQAQGVAVRDCDYAPLQGLGTGQPGEQYECHTNEDAGSAKVAVLHVRLVSKAGL
jgi:hypothetical protein